MKESLHKKKGKTPIVAIVLLVVAAVQLLLCLSGFTLLNLDQLLLMVLGAVAAVTLILALYGWDSFGGFRRGMRLLLIVVPSVAALGGLCTALYATIARPTSSVLMSTHSGSFGYNLIADSSLTLFLAQTVQMLFLPTLVAAASFGNRFDVWHLRVQAVVHFLLVAFNVFVTSTAMVGFPVWNTEGLLMPMWGGYPAMQIITVAAAALFAVGCFVPMLKKSKKEELPQ